MSRYLLSWKIGGEAGFGIKSAGLTFARAVNRTGYEAVCYDEYPSLIRGGHNSHQVTISRQPVYAPSESIDVLVALNSETIRQHVSELSHGSVILYDGSVTKVTLSADMRMKNVKLLDVPFADIVKQVKGQDVMRNAVALGASAALVHMPFGILASTIRHTYGNKSTLVDSDVQAARLGYRFIDKQVKEINFKTKLVATDDPKELLLTGNDALALGALAAGIQFYAAYPMTPSSSLLHYFAAHAADQRMIVKHAEDEISVINMALGASHMGARSMIGTSGGGFSLMVETLGLAGITETPLVIVNAMRPGPATGLPTWTEQSDLRFVLHAAQGEFPRIVLAPGDHEECFLLGARAFNYADKYQVPVIILTDKFLGEGYRTVKPFDPRTVTIDRGSVSATASQLRHDFKRYRVTPSGVSVRSVPGQKGGEYLANSDEHDEYGYTSEESANRIAQNEKRLRKLKKAARDVGGATLYGNPSARTTVVSWGSTKGPVLDALAWVSDKERARMNFLHLNALWPFPHERVEAILKRAKTTLLVENNATAQLGGLIREQTGIALQHRLLKYDGRPFFPNEIKERLLDL